MAHKWKIGVLARLPEHYKMHRMDLAKPRTPVNYIPEEGHWKRNPKTGEITRVYNLAIPFEHSTKMDEGIWGGEGIIKGFRKPNPLKKRNPYYWVPSLKQQVLYSEILNEYMTVVVTFRTLDLIDQHYGFDSYILRTPVQDLKSQLALDIRRKLILTLIKKDFWPDDPVKHNKIYEKYKDCIIPEDEAEWFGLSLKDACGKLLNQEKAAYKPVPLKVQYRKDLIEKLEKWKLDGGTTPKPRLVDTIFDKMNPFNKK